MHDTGVAASSQAILYKLVKCHNKWQGHIQDYPQASESCTYMQFTS